MGRIANVRESPSPKNPAYSQFRIIASRLRGAFLCRAENRPRRRADSGASPPLAGSVPSPRGVTKPGIRRDALLKLALFLAGQSSLATWEADQTEPEVVVPVLRLEPAPVRGPAVPGEVAPGAAARHADNARIGALGIL